MKLLGTFAGLLLWALNGYCVFGPQVPRTHSKPGHHIDPNPLNLRAEASLLIRNRIDRSGWSLSSNCGVSPDELRKAIDDDKSTFVRIPGGCNITVDLGSTQNVNGLSFSAPENSSSGSGIIKHNIFVSADGKLWEDAVATGTWYADRTRSDFESKQGRYVRLVLIGNPSTTIADLHIYSAVTNPTPGNSNGRWGPTLDFPIVPVAGAVLPQSGKVLVWSAYARDKFEGTPGNNTLSSVWDPATQVISERDVTETDHDMFCPGISMDVNGTIIVTGGNRDRKTSLYDFSSDRWVRGPDMIVARGYQSSATCSDGRIFTIGGSWNEGEGATNTNKDGEIYDPILKRWKMLPGAVVKPMLTADKRGIYRADNHAWLFGWRNRTVLQAGPSTAMNWYFTDGDGNVTGAGARKSSRGSDPDAMCGNAVMYDAIEGKILTIGGSPSYEGEYASTNAHIITIGNPGSDAKLAFAANGLNHRRIFHTSVVLPDGTVFISGGQEKGAPFEDTTPQLTPELYDPDKNQFIDQQPNSIVRVYHSISLLLPDATVFNGGGGLCDSCDTNHFDAQIFSPRYLFDDDGNRATRPVLKSVNGGDSIASVRRGEIVTIATDSAVRRASLIRYGTATHAVNTDQRRIPLEVKPSGVNAYTLSLPDDLGIMLPGYWMLFVMNDKGVPSVAKTVKVLLS